MKILRRYILREHVGPLVAALGVLTGLMLLNQLAKRFGDLVGKGLPWYLIVEVFALSIPFIFAMTMPMAVLVAVLYSFSRLSSDNEVTAFKAGGVSLLRLMLPVLVAAAGLAASMVWFNNHILPESNHKLRQLLTDIGRKQPTFELRERVVNEVVSGKLFLQAARIDRTRSTLHDMVIFDLSPQGTDRTIYADSGQMAFNETQTDLYLTLHDGSIYEREPKDPSLDQHTKYDRQVIRVSGVTNELQRGSGADWRGDREMNIPMMREEIDERRERLVQIQDSLGYFITTLDPIRENNPVVEEVEPAAEEDENEARDPERPAPRQPVAAESEEVEDPSKAATEGLRQRFTRSRRSLWPPTGDPVAFAANVRNELQRIANRNDIHRREMNRYSVEIQKKYAIPAAAIVFVLIGAPIGARFPRGGIGMVIGVSLTVFCVYYVFLIGGEELADRRFLSPFWSMWAPNVLFASLGGIILYVVSLAGTRRAWLPRWFSRPRRLPGAKAGAGRSAA
jgi:lipopolysaccharide export system permease protein